MESTDAHRAEAWRIVRQHTWSDEQSGITRDIAAALAAAEARGAAQVAVLRDALVQARPYTHSVSRVRAVIDAALSATGAAL